MNTNPAVRCRIALVATVVVSGIVAVDTFGGAAGAVSDSMRWADLEVLGAAERLDDMELASAVSASQRTYFDLIANCEGRPAPGGPGAAPYDDVAADLIVRRVRERPGSIADGDRDGFGLRDALQHPVDGGPPIPPSSPHASSECIDAASEEMESVGSTNFDALVDSYVEVVLEQPAVADARTQWQACARGFGADLNGGAGATDLLTGVLGAAVNAGPESVAAHELSEAERRLAVIVATCDRDAYAPATAEWEIAEATWMAQHRAEFTALPAHLALQWGIAVGI